MKLLNGQVIVKAYHIKLDGVISDIVNKRLNITRQKHNMPILRDLKYSRITHTDYYKWKQHINIDINIPNG